MREKRPFLCSSHETVRIPNAFSSPVQNNNWMGGTKMSWLGANTSASTAFLWCIKMHIRAHVLKTRMDVPNKRASLGRSQNKLSLFCLPGWGTAGAPGYRPGEMFGDISKAPAKPLKPRASGKDLRLICNGPSSGLKAP